MRTRTSPTIKVSGAFRSRQAFTLVELAVVAVIIGVVAIVTFPRLSALLSGRKLMGFSGKLAGTLDYVRARSVTDGRVYYFNFDKSKRQYWVTGGEDGDEPLEGKLGRPQKLPEGVSLRRIKLGEGSTRFFKPVVRFYPRGNSDGAVIYLETEQGDRASVRVKPYTGRSEVFKGFNRDY